MVIWQLSRKRKKTPFLYSRVVFPSRLRILLISYSAPYFGRSEFMGLFGTLHLLISQVSHWLRVADLHTNVSKEVCWKRLTSCMLYMMGIFILNQRIWLAVFYISLLYIIRTHGQIIPNHEENRHLVHQNLCSDIEVWSIYAWNNSVMPVHHSYVYYCLTVQ